MDSEPASSSTTAPGAFPHAAADKAPPKRRKVNTCLPCKARKVKCDKQRPHCGQCERHGQPDQCAWAEDSVPDESTSHDNDNNDIDIGIGIGGTCNTDTNMNTNSTTAHRHRNSRDKSSTTNRSSNRGNGRDPNELYLSADGRLPWYMGSSALPPPPPPPPGPVLPSLAATYTNYQPDQTLHGSVGDALDREALLLRIAKLEESLALAQKQASHQAGGDSARASETAAPRTQGMPSARDHASRSSISTALSSGGQQASPWRHPSASLDVGSSHSNGRDYPSSSTNSISPSAHHASFSSASAPHAGTNTSATSPSEISASHAAGIATSGLPAPTRPAPSAHDAACASAELVEEWSPAHAPPASLAFPFSYRYPTRAAVLDAIRLLPAREETVSFFLLRFREIDRCVFGHGITWRLVYEQLEELNQRLRTWRTKRKRGAGRGLAHASSAAAAAAAANEERDDDALLQGLDLSFIAMLFAILTCAAVHLPPSMLVSHRIIKRVEDHQRQLQIWQQSSRALLELHNYIKYPNLNVILSLTVGRQYLFSRGEHREVMANHALAVALAQLMGLQRLGSAREDEARWQAEVEAEEAAAAAAQRRVVEGKPRLLPAAPAPGPGPAKSLHLAESGPVDRGPCPRALSAGGGAGAAAPSGFDWPLPSRWDERDAAAAAAAAVGPGSGSAQRQQGTRDSDPAPSVRRTRDFDGTPLTDGRRRPPEEEGDTGRALPPNASSSSPGQRHEPVRGGGPTNPHAHPYPHRSVEPAPGPSEQQQQHRDGSGSGSGSGGGGGDESGKAKEFSSPGALTSKIFSTMRGTMRGEPQNMLACGGDFGKDNKLADKRAGFVSLDVTLNRRSHLQREAGRRLWTHLSLQDWFYGAFLGAYRIFPSQTKCSLPLNLDEEDLPDGLEDGELPEERSWDLPTDCSGQRYVYAAAELIRDLVDRSEEGVVADYELVLEYDKKFRDLMESWPVYLRIDGKSEVLDWVQREEQVRPYIRHQRLMLLESVTHRILRLHRDYLIRGEHDPTYAYSTRSCIDAARTIIFCRQEMGTQDWVIQGLWVKRYHIFHAALALSLHLLEQASMDAPPNDETDGIRQDIASALSFLACEPSMYGNSNPGTFNSRTCVSRMIEVLLKEEEARREARRASERAKRAEASAAERAREQGTAGSTSAAGAGRDAATAAVDSAQDVSARQRAEAVMQARQQLNMETIGWMAQGGGSGGPGNAGPGGVAQQQPGYGMYMAPSGMDPSIIYQGQTHQQQQQQPGQAALAALGQAVAAANELPRQTGMGGPQQAFMGSFYGSNGQPSSSSSSLPLPPSAGSMDFGHDGSGVMGGMGMAAMAPQHQQQHQQQQAAAFDYSAMLTDIAFDDPLNKAISDLFNSGVDAANDEWWSSLDKVLEGHI